MSIIIPLEIETESDLYCPFNSNHELDEDVKSYLIRKSVENNSGKVIIVRIISKEEINENNVRNAFNQWIDMSYVQIKKEYRNNLIKEVAMFAIGIFLIGVSIILQSHIDNIIFTIISTIGAFAIWEASAILIIKTPKLRSHARTIGKWAKALEFDFVIRKKENN